MTSQEVLPVDTAGEFNGQVEAQRQRLERRPQRAYVSSTVKLKKYDSTHAHAGPNITN